MYVFCSLGCFQMEVVKADRTYCKLTRECQLNIEPVYHVQTMLNHCISEAHMWRGLDSAASSSWCESMNLPANISPSPQTQSGGFMMYELATYHDEEPSCGGWWITTDILSGKVEMQLSPTCVICSTHTRALLICFGKSSNNYD